MDARVRTSFSRPGAVGLVLAALELASVVVAGVLVRDGDVAWLPLLSAALVAVAVAHAADLHQPRLVLSTLPDVPAVLVCALAATLVLAALGHAGVGFAAVAVVLLVVGRVAVLAAVAARRRSGRHGRQVVVLGCGASARDLAMTLLDRPALGLVPVGFVSAGQVERGELRGLPLSLLGGVDTLPRAMAESGAEAVVVALPDPAGAPELAAVEECLARHTDVYAVPGNLPAAVTDDPVLRERVGGLPVLRLRGDGSDPLRVTRRAVEVAVALAGLVVLVPVTALLATLVRLETGGVLVRHTQADGAGVVRRTWRFRTRHTRSLARPGTTWSVDISGRAGPIGRALLRTRLDRLPELLGVLARRLGRSRPGASRVSTRPPGPQQPQVDVGQLAG